MLPSTKPRLRMPYLAKRIMARSAKLWGFKRYYTDKYGAWMESWLGPYEPKPEPEPKTMSYHTGKRKAAKLLRTPKWADHDAIARIYRECYRLTHRTKIVHHVDHILPLQGRKVSGLHVAENLRVVTATENVRKSNTYENT